MLAVGVLIEAGDRSDHGEVSVGDLVTGHVGTAVIEVLLNLSDPSAENFDAVVDLLLSGLVLDQGHTLRGLHDVNNGGVEPLCLKLL